jgi:hypothetical protein
MPPSYWATAGLATSKGRQFPANRLASLPGRVVRSPSEAAAHGTWFDTGELGTLITNLRAAQRADPSTEVQVKCIGCGKSVPRRETLVGELGAVCAPCARGAKLAALPETPARLAGSILLDLHEGMYRNVPR